MQIGFLGGYNPVEFTHGGYYNYTGTWATTATITSSTLADADADRWVYALFSFLSDYDRAISSVSIGGISATEVIKLETFDNSTIYDQYLWSCIYKANVPTGTSVTATLTLNGIKGAGNKYMAAIFSAIGDGSGFTEVTDSDTTSSSTLTASIPNQIGAYCIGLVTATNGTSFSPPSGISFTETTRLNKYAENNHIHAYLANNSLGEINASISGTFSKAQIVACSIYGA